jgi:hypothetical protein
MSLDDLTLSPYLHKSFFRNKLIDLCESIASDGNPVEKEIVFLGEHNKHHVFVVDEKGFKFLEEKNLHFFLQLIEACKFTLQDIALLNRNSQPALNYKEINDKMDAKTVVCFGLTTTDLDLPFSIPSYQVQKFENTAYLIAPDLAALRDNPTEKKLLWGALQKIYNL